MLILKENSEKIRQALTDAGIKPCVCTTFKNNVWLDYTGATSTMVHGLGCYGDDVGTTSIQEELDRVVKENKNIIYCKDVTDFINKIKEFENGRSNKE